MGSISTTFGAVRAHLARLVAEPPAVGARGSAATGQSSGLTERGSSLEESGFRQITRSSPRPASRSRFDAEQTPPST